MNSQKVPSNIHDEETIKKQLEMRKNNIDERTGEEIPAVYWDHDIDESRE